MLSLASAPVDRPAATGRRSADLARLRVILIGSAAERQELRTRSSFEVVAEFPTMAAARASGVAADAILTPFKPPAESDVVEEPLTAREIDVLELLAEGLPNKAIAARLRISDQTVKFHVSSICSKLLAANRTEAVRHAIRRGLVTV
jgi:DNA-binding NarL/FixJ family response regulator